MDTNNYDIICWGDNTYGTCNPPQLKDVIAISAGFWHGMALRSNGTVVCWGKNIDGQCDIPNNLKKVIAISAGNKTSYVLQYDGTVVGWGNNNDKTIFNGKLVSIGCHIPPGLNKVVAITTNMYDDSITVLKNDGTLVHCGTRIDNNTCSVQIELKRVVLFATTGENNMVIQEDGTTKAWGRNISSEALKIPSKLNSIKSITGSGDSFIALTNNGTVIPLTNVSLDPNKLKDIEIEKIPIYMQSAGLKPLTNASFDKNGFMNNVVAISGKSHVIALNSNGTVVCWGSNYRGVLNVPVGLKDVVAISAGGLVSMALKYNGLVSRPTIRVSLLHTIVGFITKSFVIICILTLLVIIYIILNSR